MPTIIDKDQLNIAEKLVPLMEKMALASARIDRSQEMQVESMKKLADAMDTLNTKDVVADLNQVTQNVKVLVDKLNALGGATKQSMSEMSKQAGTAATSVSSLNAQLTKSTTSARSLNSVHLDGLLDELEYSRSAVEFASSQFNKLGKYLQTKFPKHAAVTIGFLSGMQQSFQNIVAVGKSVFGFFGGLVDAIANIGGAILAIPFKMFNGLIDMANAMDAGSTELLQAIENIRREFGALGQKTPQTIMTMAKSLKGFSDTGLSAWRVFGNMAQRLEDFLKLAQEMGPMFELFTDEFSKNGGALLAWQKGLGLTGEQMSVVAQRALVAGTTMSDYLMQVQKQSLDLGKTFGISSKLISRDTVKAAADVKHFANVTVKEISQAAVYARKLGVELDKITGTLDAFETFDQAADNASKLSQAFGLNVDAFKMMEAQDPAKQIEMLRTQMAAAGQDASQFNRQQISLLASSTGLSAETARQVFALKNQGVSLENIKKKSESAEKQQLSQAQAMSKLADSIERMVQSGGGRQGGFFDRFFHGFMGGLQATKEFRTMLMNIRRGLMMVEFQGVRLGRAFANLMPGMREFLGGISDFFNPKKFKDLFAGITDELIKFFKGFASGQFSFATLMDNLKEKFFNFFDRSTGPGKRILGGFEETFRTLTKIAAGAITWVSDQVAVGITFITDLISGKRPLALGSATGALGFLGPLLEPIVEALGHAWVTLKPALLELVTTVGNELWKWAKEVIAPKLLLASPFLATALMGPAFGKAILSGLSVTFGQMFVKTATSLLQSKLPKIFGPVQQAVEAGTKVEAIAGKADTAAKGIEITGKISKASDEVMNDAKKSDWGGRDAVKLGLKLVAIAGAVAIGGVAIAYAIREMQGILGTDEKAVDRMKAPLLALAAVVVGSVPLMGALRIANKIGNPREILKGGAVVAASVGMVGLVGAGLGALLGMIAPEKLLSAGKFMGMMSVVFLSMIPLIVASAALGALASGPQAAFLGASAVAGFAIIGVTVSAVAEISTSIIKQLNGLVLEPGYQPKIDAFLGVMKAVGAMTDTIVKLVSLMTPSFTELLSGKASSFAEKVNSSIDLMHEFIGQRGQNKGIIGLIDYIMDVVKGISVTSGLTEASNLFTNILSTVTGALQAMTPPPEFFEAQASFTNLFDAYVGRKSLTTATEDYMTILGEQMKSMTKTVNDIIAKFSTTKLPEESKVRTIGNMISTVATLIKALLPDPTVMKAFTNTMKESSWLTGSSEVSAINVVGLTKFITAYTTQLQDLIPVLTSKVMGSMSTAAASLKDSKDIEKVSAIGSVMKVVADIIGAINNVGKGATIKVDNVAERAVLNVNASMPNVARIMVEVGEQMGQFVTNLIVATKAVPTDKEFMGHLKSAKDLFGLFGEVAKLSSSLMDVAKTSGAPVGNTDPLIASVTMMASFLNRLVGIDASSSQASPLLELIDGLSAVTSVLASKHEMIGTMTKSFATEMGQITTLGKTVGKYSDEMGKMATSITHGGVAEGLMAINNMIQQVNGLNNSLGTLPNINLDAKLKTVATNVGLGGKFNYQIKNKDVVMNINLSVTMNAEDLETALILRAKSVIRERINWATENPNTTIANPLPETPGPILAPVGKS